MHWLESVTDLRQSTTDDDRHRIIDVTGLHLLVEVDRVDAVVAVTTEKIVAHMSPFSIRFIEYVGNNPSILASNATSKHFWYQIDTISAWL